MPDHEEDLTFVDLGGDRRRNTATSLEPIGEKSSSYLILLERETGIEPATLSLGSFLANGLTIDACSRILKAWTR